MLEVDLRGADLTEAYLCNVRLNGANLSEAKLDRAILGGEDCIPATMNRAVMIRTSLVDDSISGVSMPR